MTKQSIAERGAEIEARCRAGWRFSIDWPPGFVPSPWEPTFVPPEALANRARILALHPPCPRPARHEHQAAHAGAAQHERSAA